ncbi:protein kinase [Legionella sp. MW5194]|uniref:protein kinase n=1 Tax=Legionella sp. MW5194 TaxID=2662448 RepID=UPI00193CB4D8|nr:protein kinase [Legionella sp. MW5194]QRN04072.1 protein kinase [Legionella sp. MW5194]
MPPLDTLNNANSKEEIELPEQAATTIDLSANGFHKVRHLGGGAFGEVALYQYTGSNPAYLSLCDSQGLVAIKLLLEPDEHEEAAARLIAKHSESGQTDLSAINRTFPLEIDGQLVGILSEYESYLDFKDGHLTQFSSNLYSLIADTFHPLESHDFPGVGVALALKSNPAVFLAQIACGLVKGQDTLHQMSMLHQDSAARNFLIRTERDSVGNVLGIVPKISDYGLTSILAEGEQNGVYSNRNKVPLRIIDNDVIKTGGQTSLITDYYARKTAMMSILAQMLSKLPGELAALSLKPGTTQPVQEFFADRMGKFSDNGTALKQLLNNVIAYLEQNPDKHLKQEVEFFIQCYEPWLTFCPDGADLQKARGQEMALFNECNNRFVETYYEYMILNKKNTSAQDFLLGLKRLNRIDVNNPIQPMIQGNIRQLERDLAQKTTTPPTDEHRSMTQGARTMTQPIGVHHYGRIQTVQTAPPTVLEDDGQTHYNNLLSREAIASPLNQQNLPPQHPVASQDPSSHYAKTSIPVNAPAIEGNDGETPYSRMIPQERLTGATTQPNRRPSQNPQPSTDQNSHYTSLGRSQPQSARETQPASPHYSPLSNRGNTQTRGDYSRVIGTHTHPVNTLPQGQAKETDTPRKLKTAMPETRQTHASHGKATIKAIWSDFVHEVEHHLDKLSPKDNAEEMRKKFKTLLKEAQTSIKTLLHIKEATPVNLPKDEDLDEHEDDNESLHL